MGAPIPQTEIERRIREKLSGYKLPYLKKEVAAGGIQGTLTVDCAKHGKSQLKIHSVIYADSKCKACGAFKPKKYSTVRIIELAREKHGDKFDYSKTVFTTLFEKIIVRCPEHGEWTPTAQNHALKGSGCPRCGKLSVARHLLANPKRGFKSSQTRVIEGKEFHTDSRAERRVLDLLCAKHGAALVFDQRSIETFQYSYKGKIHLHRPDFCIPSKNILVEVKSPATSGACVGWKHDKRKDLIGKLIEKAKAARALGHKYYVAIVLSRRKDAVPIIMPTGWESIYDTPGKLAKFLRIKGNEKI